MHQLHEFLLKNKDEIFAIIEDKNLDLPGTNPTSELLRQGLPIFFQQFLEILLLERSVITKLEAANSGKTEESKVTKTAGLHGAEMLRLGYSLSHVVRAYGAMCQSVTELAAKKDFTITTSGFHDLNRSLDIAIASAVTEYQTNRDTQEKSREVKQLGFLAHELRNALNNATMSLQLVKNGTVGLAGRTGEVLEKSLKRMDDLINRSLTEVRLQSNPEVYLESSYLLQIVDNILVTARVDAELSDQKFEISIDPALVVRADQQAFHSALYNLIQNALKYSRDGGRIQVRGRIIKENIEIEVEDECGGLLSATTSDLFKPFVQKNENRAGLGLGLGLGLTIAQRAIELSGGTIDACNLPNTGCIFKITLPNDSNKS